MLTCHTLISGFRQHVGYTHGLVRLRERFLAAGLQHGVDHRVSLRTWHDDVRRMADELVVLHDLTGQCPRIGVYAYSYGGWAATRFARALQRRGIRVEAMVLSDPVRRWPLRLQKPLSLLPRWAPWQTLRIPANVREVHHFYQTVDLPQGHRLAADGETTIMGRRLDCGHARMDDAEEFQRAALCVAQALHDGRSMRWDE